MKKLLMGNEAIALGALRAGVLFASGYPGTPSSEILETLVKERARSAREAGGEKAVSPYIEWSVNEKAALETAAGAALSGARALVTMKQVGLNVASDPLMSLAYTGVKGGFVVVSADDPGPVSSQTEQDSRTFAAFAHIACFDPSSPSEAYALIAEAFALSERIARPVLFRPSTRVCHSYEPVELLPPLKTDKPEGFTKDNGKWVIFPRLSYLNHIKNNEIEASLKKTLSSHQHNFFEKPAAASSAAKKGIAAGGVSYCYVKEALSAEAESIKLLKISVYPFPEDLAADFLEGLDEVTVFEELDPVIEKELLILCGKRKLSVKIKGKLSGDVPAAGELSAAIVKETLFGKGAITDGAPHGKSQSLPQLPARPPVLCAGCPHRASFQAIKEAAAETGKEALYSGDIGCYTLGNTLGMTDTCLCMGAGITMAQGLWRIEPDVLHFAFIGDSTFFHSGITGVVNAVWNGASIIIAVLDNGTTAMTGGQAHPGLGKTIDGSPAPDISIEKITAALGVNFIRRVNAFNAAESKQALREAIKEKGVRVLIFEGRCVTLNKARKGENK